MDHCARTPAMTRVVGTLRSGNGTGVVRLEDRYDTDIDDLWPALRPLVTMDPPHPHLSRAGPRCLLSVRSEPSQSGPRRSVIICRRVSCFELSRVVGSDHLTAG